MKTPIAPFIVTVALLSGQAFAHGGAPHAKAAFDVATAEQTDFGIAGDPAKVARTITIDAHDTFRFAPSEIHVKQGETIRFIVKNPGKLTHEMVIGTLKELKEHAELMRKFPDMEHNEPHMTHLPPGKTGEIVWRFNRPGEFHFACLIAGHFEAGMVGKIVVQ